jgi:hypothetical protein
MDTRKPYAGITLKSTSVQKRRDMRPLMSQDLLTPEHWSVYYVNYVDGTEVTINLKDKLTEQECLEYIATLERNT